MEGCELARPATAASVGGGTAKKMTDIQDYGASWLACHDMLEYEGGKDRWGSVEIQSKLNAVHTK